MSQTEARERNNKRDDAGQGGFDQEILVVPASSWHEEARRLRVDGFESLVDLCGVDYLGFPAGAADGTRFEVVVNLLSYSRNARARVRVSVDGDEPRCPSVCDIWPGANWFERETYDMFGIEFDGHPDLSRILMPDDWDGHPLRKDFATGAVPVQFSDSPKPR